jgi:hypothetical protein
MKYTFSAVTAVVAALFLTAVWLTRRRGPREPFQTSQLLDLKNTINNNTNSMLYYIQQSRTIRPDDKTALTEYIKHYLFAIDTVISYCDANGSCTQVPASSFSNINELIINSPQNDDLTSFIIGSTTLTTYDKQNLMKYIQDSQQKFTQLSIQCSNGICH